MSNFMIGWVCILIFFFIIGIIGFIDYFKPFTPKVWNNGVCPNCGIPWEEDGDWDSNNGWQCPRCLKHISVGGYWRRDFYKKKNEEYISKHIQEYDKEHSNEILKNSSPKVQNI